MYGYVDGANDARCANNLLCFPFNHHRRCRRCLCRIPTAYEWIVDTVCNRYIHIYLKSRLKCSTEIIFMVILSFDDGDDDDGNDDADACGLCTSCIIQKHCYRMPHCICRSKVCMCEHGNNHAGLLCDTKW